MKGSDSPPRRLTVAQLVPDLNAGGVERTVLNTSRALVERGHRSLVVSNGGRLVDELIADGGEHLTLDLGRKSPLTLRHVPALRRWLREQRVDVLHPQSRMPAWVAYLSWRGMPPPEAPHARPHFITSVHGLHSVSWYSAIVTRGEKIQVVSEVARDYLLKNFPRVVAERIVVNPLGVDPQAFPFGHRPDDAWLRQWRAEFPQLDGKFAVTLPGRLTRLKGHHDLLDVIAKLPPRFHGLIVGGEDPKRQAYARELRAAVADRGLDDRVTFTGHRDDIRDVLAVIGAAVSLSTKPESFGLAVLESVALGRPTVGYDHGGVGEVLAKVYPAGRVPKGDIRAVATRLQEIESGQVSPPEADPSLAGLTLDTSLDRSLALYESLA